MDLTTKQAECLTAIHDITRAQGYPPTNAELGAYLNVTLTAASYHVSNLRRLGYVEPRIDRKSRRTRLTDEGMALFRKG